MAEKRSKHSILKKGGGVVPQTVVAQCPALATMSSYSRVKTRDDYYAWTVPPPAGTNRVTQPYAGVEVDS